MVYYQVADQPSNRYEVAGNQSPFAVNPAYGTDFYTKPFIKYPPITLNLHDVTKGVAYGALSHILLRLSHTEKSVKSMALAGYLLGAGFSGFEKLIDGSILGQFYGAPAYGAGDNNFLPQAVFQAFVVSGGISAGVNALITLISKKTKR